MSDTIFALSSGAPPAAIGVIRISGPACREAVRALIGGLPAPRRASYRRLRAADGEDLDRAIVLWLPGPGTATGEDMAELHCHGGRAVVAAVEAALSRAELRRATPGEFTRRAFVNSRIDLAEAEGLADLLTAETELQRRSAMAMAGGVLSRQVEAWRERLLDISAAVEALLDFADEDDVTAPPDGIDAAIAGLLDELRRWLERPRSEALREGFRVVLAGPPNAGKSTLFNALSESDAAITAPTAGTTRDVLTKPVAIDGVPFLLLDTAGLHDAPADPIEAIGVERALAAARHADLVLWLGAEGKGPLEAWEVEAKIDRPMTGRKASANHRVSAVTGEGIDDLRRALVLAAKDGLPKPGEAALSRRQHDILTEVYDLLERRPAQSEADLLILAEHLRLARVQCDALIGRTGTDDMLDALFGRFCIGK